jgi:HSF-type DNA-binding
MTDANDRTGASWQLAIQRAAQRDAATPNNDQQARRCYGRHVRTGFLFPVQLHRALQEIERDGLEHIVSWAAHGQCLVIHRSQEFASQVLPRYEMSPQSHIRSRRAVPMLTRVFLCSYRFFRHNHWASFQRQLNLYGFQRIPWGPDRGGYYHKHFCKDRPSLCWYIQRISVKGTRLRTAGPPTWQPNVYKLQSSAKVQNVCTDTIDSENSARNSALEMAVDDLLADLDPIDCVMIDDFCSDWSSALGQESTAGHSLH